MTVVYALQALKTSVVHNDCFRSIAEEASIGVGSHSHTLQKVENTSVKDRYRLTAVILPYASCGESYALNYDHNHNAGSSALRQRLRVGKEADRSAILLPRLVKRSCWLTGAGQYYVKNSAHCLKVCSITSRCGILKILPKKTSRPVELRHCLHQNDCLDVI